MIIIKVKWLGNSALLIEAESNIVIDPLSLIHISEPTRPY